MEKLSELLKTEEAKFHWNGETWCIAQGGWSTPYFEAGSLKEAMEDATDYLENSLSRKFSTLLAENKTSFGWDGECWGLTGYYQNGKWWETEPQPAENLKEAEKAATKFLLEKFGGAR